LKAWNWNEQPGVMLVRSCLIETRAMGSWNFGISSIPRNALLSAEP